MRLLPPNVREVLILVVMEDSLGRLGQYLQQNVPVVLILVVMEDSLGPKIIFAMKGKIVSLNPCCNGR